eukprot:TRINITY_DN47959_c0_g1_i1.p1 TRINITY_DN47959_c0_g1~~TRINITY_DN47959_c0_g1_i1.p1  ORF type:complete len:459 (+),score=39.98 TRINITY_DN47959_c0_g1_i1:140-1516(+)
MLRSLLVFAWVSGVLRSTAVRVSDSPESQEEFSGALPDGTPAPTPERLGLEHALLDLDKSAFNLSKSQEGDAKFLPVPNPYLEAAANSMLQTGLHEIYQIFERMQTVWSPCERKLRGYWDAHRSEYIQKNTIVTFKSRLHPGETYYGFVKTHDETSVTVQHMDTNSQKNKDIEERVAMADVSFEGTFRDVVSAMVRHKCVEATQATVYNEFRSLRQRVGAYFQRLVDKFMNNGVIKLVVAVGASIPTFLPTSLKAEGGFSVAIWPPKVLGTVAGTVCGGKDTNHFSIDMTVGLAVGFDRGCFAGNGIEFEVAVQLPANTEIAFSVAFAAADNGLPETMCFLPGGCTPCAPPYCMPVIDEVSVAFGVAAKGNVASPWNPMRQFVSLAFVGCRDTEILSNGPRDSDCKTGYRLPTANQAAVYVATHMDSAIRAGIMGAQGLPGIIGTNIGEQVGRMIFGA